ncbi:MAG: Smr/MutS family protein, partial [Mangrovibacterium sp.]
IRENQADKEKTRLVRKQLETFKEELSEPDEEQDEWIQRKIDKLKQKQQQRKEKKANPAGAETPSTPKLTEDKELEQGDKVRIEGQDSIGEVLELNDKNAIVAFGQLRTSVSRKKLQVVSNNEARREQKNYNQTKANINKSLSEKRLVFKSEIDVRGQRAEEAISNIQTFIDEAIMLNIHELRILHGKGNGILKEVLRNFLKADPAVRSFRDEHVQFGGAGITIVELG